MHKGDEGSPLADNPRSPRHDDDGGGGRGPRSQVGSYFDLAAATGGEVKVTHHGVIGDKRRVSAFPTPDEDILMGNCGCDDVMDDDDLSDLSDDPEGRNAHDLLDPLRVNF